MINISECNKISCNSNKKLYLVIRFTFIIRMQSFFVKKKSAFTLIEVTLVAVILGILIPSIFSIYNFIVKSNREVRARQDAIQQGYEFFEKLNIWLQNYTIDYEEYYNRQMV